MEKSAEFSCAWSSSHRSLSARNANWPASVSGVRRLGGKFGAGNVHQSNSARQCTRAAMCYSLQYDTTLSQTHREYEKKKKSFSAISVERKNGFFYKKHELYYMNGVIITEHLRFHPLEPTNSSTQHRQTETTQQYRSLPQPVMCSVRCCCVLSLLAIGFVALPCAKGFVPSTCTARSSNRAEIHDSSRRYPTKRTSAAAACYSRTFTMSGRLSVRAERR